MYMTSLTVKRIKALPNALVITVEGPGSQHSKATGAARSEARQWAGDLRRGKVYDRRSAVTHQECGTFVARFIFATDRPVKKRARA